jgi:hypothetical protein
MVVGYLVKQLITWIADFFHHWYVEGLYGFLRALMKTLSGLDRVMALRVNTKNIFKPMYQDNSFIGYMFGFVFRSTRVIAAIMVYSFISLFFFFAYLTWALIPPFFIISAFNINVTNLF